MSEEQVPYEGEDKKEESFLEMLYHCEESEAVPVVNGLFLERLNALSEEDQYKAMGHLQKISNTFSRQDGLQERVYRDRCTHLFKTWFDYHTEDWVWENYGAALDNKKWDRTYAIDATADTISLEEAKKELGL